MNIIACGNICLPSRLYEFVNSEGARRPRGLVLPLRMVSLRAESMTVGVGV